MRYFLHDTSAFQDEKVTELFIKFGFEGIGLFFTILEKIAYQEKPIKTDVLKHQLKVGKKLNKCWNFLEQIDLISSNNGETFNKQLLNFSEKYQIKKEKNAKRILQWRKNQDIEKNVTHSEQICNNPKEKIIKEKIIKVKKEEETIFSPDVENLFLLSKKHFDEKYLTKKVKDVFRLLLENDNYTYEQIKNSILNAKGNQFWNDKFLSPLKLRQKNKSDVFYIDVFLNLMASNKSEQGNIFGKSSFNN